MINGKFLYSVLGTPTYYALALIDVKMSNIEQYTYYLNFYFVSIYSNNMYT